MSQSNTDICDVINDRLQQHSTTISFDSVWGKHQKEGNARCIGIKRTVSIPMIVLITILTGFMIGFASYGIIRTVDNTDYPFVEDKRVIGKWQSVDFVGRIGQFDPDEKAYKDELYLTELAFINGGDMLASFEGGNLAYTSFTWTNGLVLNKQEETASKYEIKEIDGQTYMFFEWKSGDYIFREMKPQYYVLKKIDSNDYANIEIPRKVDKTDYPFINDPQILGTWQSVDFVKDIDDFKPRKMSWLGGLHLTEFIILENGELTASFGSESAPRGIFTWTEGLIINNPGKTAGKYEIREIDGESYMFFEWKNGDYVYRGATPWYYVLKKVE